MTGVEHEVFFDACPASNGRHPGGERLGRGCNGSALFRLIMAACSARQRLAVQRPISAHMQCDVEKNQQGSQTWHVSWCPGGASVARRSMDALHAMSFVHWRCKAAVSRKCRG